jgi:alginate O-acetyltransferase complex protein AlgI
MLFHTLAFILFFILVFILNTLLVNVVKASSPRKVLLFIASLVFYASWSVKLLFLMLFCIACNYVCGRLVTSDGPRKRWVTIAVTLNLTILGIFKYLDFGIQSFASLASSLGFQVNPGSLEIILPLGISFYTFQSMAYVIDVYRGKYKPYESILDFSLFVSFFPQLVAGPIVRADFFLKSLHDFSKPINLQAINSGLYLFVLGVFKKAVLADNAAHIANMGFNNANELSSLMVLMGVVAFSAQIYFDFSGYTDMARGLGRMLGIQLPENFNRPYIAKGIRDFWKRWHISLSTWLRDYLYISLGGSRTTAIKTYRNLFLTMLLGGLWHGASMNFVFWGVIHGTLLIGEHYLDQRGLNHAKWWCVVKPWLAIPITYCLVLITWIFFRSADFDMSMTILSKITDFSGYANLSELRLFSPQNWAFGLLLPYLFIWGFENFKLRETSDMHPFVRAVLFCVYLFLILLASGGTNEFIYFQF